VKQRIVLLGPPASGKGTQAALIQAKYGFPVASPGAIFREQKNAGTTLGIQADQLTSRGELVPDEMVLEVVKIWLSERNGAFVLDGVPRTTGQAAALETLLNTRGTPVDVAVALSVDFDAIQDRVLRRMVCSRCGEIVSIGLHVQDEKSPCPVCGGVLRKRNDDTLETLQRRMEEYASKTAPLLPFYAERGLLAEVPAQSRPETVFADVQRIIEQI
jgi:adenylate kinase